ncbi:SulP family sulfate permease [Jatrophihabitans sp. GAS493]|uniref:SulP family inorganic anion transporter n=1 Tax=Jatrophihabitans sp. GAS493 TaxID=1907575 RepID=UPI000BBF4DDD|nr:SulP family inorganic anion transporter [Jatrophihabitans sp. GAS493]SOD74540.1 SulP family sulfate permease [Jatrophihabitans sp. GAS493]
MMPAGRRSVSLVDVPDEPDEPDMTDVTWRARARVQVATALPRLRHSAPPRESWRDDVLAGLAGAIGSVPDGMASSVLVGVSPVHGLYASFAGRIGGGFSTSTKLMVVTTTSAAALAAGSALAGVSAADRPDALFLLTLLSGVLMIVAGVLHFGRYTRFVPHSVMIGFLTGISVNIILSQIPTLLGYTAHGSFSLAKTVDTLQNLHWSQLPSLATGLSAIALTVGLSRTRLAPLSAVLALLIPTLLVILLGADSVPRVHDSGEIPLGLPMPHLPPLSALNFSVVTGALAVTAIVLIQGAGVAEAAPNPNGTLSDANRDFIGQGVGNIAAGLFKGQPVGGSVGQTSLNVTAGARSRWGAIFSGLWLLLILLLFAELVGKVAMPTLAGVLIVAGVASLRVSQIETIWLTSTISKVGMTTTFLATLFLPVAAAVGIGVALALMLQLNQEALDLRVVELVPAGIGGVAGQGLEGFERFEEHPAPKRLTAETVTVLDIYGSLFYAGARTLQTLLPDPAFAPSAVVVLRLRGRTMVGATFVVVVEDYLRRLRAGGGQLYLSGVDPELWKQLSRFDRFESADDMHIVRADIVIGASTRLAYDRATQWIESRKS